MFISNRAYSKLSMRSRCTFVYPHQSNNYRYKWSTKFKEYVQVSSNSYKDTYFSLIKVS